MKQLTLQARALPSNDLPSDENQLVMVTFCDNGTCQTHFYNRAQLPREVKRIYRITRVPFSKTR